MRPFLSSLVLTAGLLPLFSVLSWAVDFNGHWKGIGQLTQAGLGMGNSTTPCSVVEVEIEHRQGALTIRKYRATCGQLQPDWGPRGFEIRGTGVFEEDEQVGSIEGDILRTLASSGGVQYAFNLRQKNVPGPRVLETYYGVRNAVGTLVIEGNLQPVP